MMLPVFEGLTPTTAGDRECAALADRHYSRATPGARQFAPPGRKLILRDSAGLVVFVWLYAYPGLRLDGRDGYNCTLFRNEGERRSSAIVLEAEALAAIRWGPGPMFTYVDPRRVASRNPGYCFKMAGWRFSGRSRSGLHLLVKP